MRLLFLNSVGFLGGAERMLLTAISSARTHGHEAHLIACTDGPLIVHARAAGATSAIALPMPQVMAAAGDSAGLLAGIGRSLIAAPLLWAYIRNLRWAIRDIKPDLIHSNGLKTHMLLWAVNPRPPVVWHLHDFLAPRPMASRLLRQVSGRASRAIAISRAVAADAATIIPKTPIDVVLNAIDTHRFTPADGDPDALDRLANLEPMGREVVRIGLIATYARWKGQDLFLRAAARAAHQNPGLALRFFIIGGAIYHTAGSQWSADELKSLADDLGIARRVGLVPFQSDPLLAYRSLDVIVHASTKPEPFGLTILEAMSCGKAVIATNAGGAPEIFEDGLSAIGFAQGDEAALSAAIAQLAGDANLRATLGRAARIRATTHFNQDRFATELMAAYQAALRKR